MRLALANQFRLLGENLAYSRCQSADGTCAVVQKLGRSVLIVKRLYFCYKIKHLVGLLRTTRPRNRANHSLDAVTDSLRERESQTGTVWTGKPDGRHRHQRSDWGMRKRKFWGRRCLLMLPTREEKRDRDKTTKKDNKQGNR